MTIMVQPLPNSVLAVFPTGEQRVGLGDSVQRGLELVTKSPVTS